MKKFFILVLIFSVFVTGCSSLHWRGKIPEYTEKRYVVREPDKVLNICLEEEDVPVEILASEDNHIYLTYFVPEDESEWYEIYEEQDSVKIKKFSKSNYGIFLFGDEGDSGEFQKRKLKLYLPGDYIGNVEVRMLDGEITVADVQIDTLTISASDADVSFQDTKIEKSLLCSTRDGDVDGNLAGQMQDYTFEIKTDGGRSNLVSGGSGSKRISIKTNDGTINLKFSN